MFQSIGSILFYSSFFSGLLTSPIISQATPRPASEIVSDLEEARAVIDDGGLGLDEGEARSYIIEKQKVTETSGAEAASLFRQSFFVARTLLLNGPYGSTSSRGCDFLHSMELARFIVGCHDKDALRIYFVEFNKLLRKALPYKIAFEQAFRITNQQILERRNAK